MSNVSESFLKQVDNKAKDFYSSPLISSVLHRFETQLPEGIYYHTGAHTREVIREVVLLGMYDNLQERSIELLALAAAYHDIGFLFQKRDNEGIAAEIAREEILASGVCSPDEVSLIQDMILDTRVMVVDRQFTRVVSSELSRYLLDADLGNLGCKDFFIKNALILKESDVSEEEFSKMTVSLLSNHRWLTPAGLVLREEQRVKNLAEYMRRYS
jgi:uncharacterized protein